MTTRTEGDSLDAVREKYREEREKRIRQDGPNQYVAVSGEFARYQADPRTPRREERSPIEEDCDVLMVGAGLGGLVLAARFREAGYGGRIRFIDKAGDFGGNWYWNRYPGAECDTESYIYMPLLEETGYIPSEKYAKAPEIFEHARRIARHYGFEDGALFQTIVTSMDWDEERARWRVTTDRGDEFRARYVGNCAGGGLQTPKLPGIPGLGEFQGHAFHTGRWDFEYTGGHNQGDLYKLRDKRVAVIGTGGSGIQCIPHLGESAEHLYVFQRTPSSIDVRANRSTDDDFRASLEPGWQKRRQENFSLFTSGAFTLIPQNETPPEDMVGDAWTAVPRRLGSIDRSGMSHEELVALVEQLDLEKMEEIRNRVDEIVEDKGVAEALKPYYRLMCKRPCFHDTYLKTFNRPNVTLVDTKGKGVERITAQGVVANGEEYEVDLIVFASGYGAPGGGFEITGRDGVRLSDKLAKERATLYGVQTHGFPNLFMLSAIQAGISLNHTHVVEVETRHLARIFKRAMEHDFQTVDVRRSAEEEWVATIERTSLVDKNFANFLESCTPGYYNGEGQPHPEARRRNGFYGPGIVQFQELLDEWYAEGSFEGLEFTDRPIETAPGT